MFGAELDTVVAREPRPPHAPPVPLIVRRCVEEIERRGLDIIGKSLLDSNITKNSCKTVLPCTFPISLSYLFASRLLTG